MLSKAKGGAKRSVKQWMERVQGKTPKKRGRPPVSSQGSTDDFVSAEKKPRKKRSKKDVVDASQRSITNFFKYADQESLGSVSEASDDDTKRGDGSKISLEDVWNESVPRPTLGEFPFSNIFS